MVNLIDKLRIPASINDPANMLIILNAAKEAADEIETLESLVSELSTALCIAADTDSYAAAKAIASYREWKVSKGK